MADAKITISAQDNTRQAVESSKNNIASLVTAVSTGFTAITTASGLVGKAFNSVAEGLGELVRHGITATDELQKFSTLLGSEDNASSLLGALDKLDDITMATKDDLASFAQELIVMGKSQSEIQNIITATVNLSNTSGRGFTEVQGAMQRALAGSTTAIEKILPELKELSKDAYDNGDAFKYMNDKLGEASITISSGSFSQKLDNISSSWERIQENIGSTIVANIQSTGILDSIYSVLQDIETNTSQSGNEKGLRSKDAGAVAALTPEQLDTFYNNYFFGYDAWTQSYTKTYDESVLNAYLADPTAWIDRQIKNGSLSMDIVNGYISTGYASSDRIASLNGKVSDIAEGNDVYSGYGTFVPQLNWGVNSSKGEDSWTRLQNLLDEQREKELKAEEEARKEYLDKINQGISNVTSAVNSVGTVINYWKDGYNAGDVGGTINSIADIVSIFNPTVGNLMTAGGTIFSYMEGLFGSSSSSDASDAAAVRTATYNGATTIHINNYFDGSYIVGSGGMAELAGIIQDELNNKAYTRT